MEDNSTCGVLRASPGDPRHPAFSNELFSAELVTSATPGPLGFTKIVKLVTRKLFEELFIRGGLEAMKFILGEKDHKDRKISIVPRQQPWIYAGNTGLVFEIAKQTSLAGYKSFSGYLMSQDGFYLSYQDKNRWWACLSKDAVRILLEFTSETECVVCTFQEPYGPSGNGYLVEMIQDSVRFLAFSATEAKDALKFEIFKVE